MAKCLLIYSNDVIIIIPIIIKINKDYYCYWLYLSQFFLTPSLNFITMRSTNSYCQIFY